MEEQQEKTQGKKQDKKLWKIFWSTFYLSAFTFGGGYVIVSLMKKKFVDEYHWIEEEEMLDLVFTQISDMLGYSSFQFFSVQFKKFTRMTASEYASSVKNFSGTE